MATIPRWARSHAACLDCGTDHRPHQARGYCWRCYAVRYLADELKGTLRHADNRSILEERRREALADDLWRAHLAAAGRPMDAIAGMVG